MHLVSANLRDEMGFANPAKPAELSRPDSALDELRFMIKKMSYSFAIHAVFSQLQAAFDDEDKDFNKSQP